MMRGMNLRRSAAALAMTLVASVGAVTVAATPAQAGGMFRTLANLNLRTCQVLENPICLPVYTVIPNNTYIYLNCWAYGTSINGDNIWYNAWYGDYTGMVAGWYMETGADPNPSVSRCI